MPPIAAIDFGTNTFHVLVVNRLKTNKLIEVSRKRHYVYMDRDDSKLIEPAAYQDAVNAALEIKLILEQYNCTSVRAVATEVFRKKANGQALLTELSRIIEHEIDLITGDKEAELIHSGVSNSYASEKPFLIMDIGGGSTEFILSKAQQIIWKKSFKLGLSVLMQHINYRDQLTKNQLHRLVDFLKEALDEIAEHTKKSGTEMLLLNGGAAELLPVALDAQAISQGCYQIELDDFNALVDDLKYSTIEQRSKLTWLVRERLRLFPLFLVIVDIVMDRLELNELVYSPASLKEGLLLTENNF